MNAFKSHACTGLLLALPLLGLLGCDEPSVDPKTTNSEPQAATVRVAVVTNGNLHKTVDLPVTIEGYEQAKLVPRIEGYVRQVPVNIGDEVKQGDLLVELDVPELIAEVERRNQMVAKAQADMNSRKAEVLQAQAQLAEQQSLLRLRNSELSRIGNLVRGGALKKEKVEEAQFAVDSATSAIARVQADINTATAHVQSSQAEVGVAEAELAKSKAVASYTQILAPFDGLITGRMVDPGAFARPVTGKDSRPLMEIASVNQVRAVIFLPMEDAMQIDDGDRVVLHSLQSGGGQKIEGAVSRHSNSFHRGSRMMRAEVDLDNSMDENTGQRRFKVGDYGKASVTLVSGKDVAEMPTVPKTALATQNGAHYVMVVDAANKCFVRNVTVLVEGELNVALTSGVKAGERVIADGVKNYENGQQLAADSIVTTTVPMQ